MTKYSLTPKNLYMKISVFLLELKFKCEIVIWLSLKIFRGVCTGKGDN